MHPCSLKSKRHAYSWTHSVLFLMLSRPLPHHTSPTAKIEGNARNIYWGCNPHYSQKSYVQEIFQYMLRVTRDYLYLVLIQALTELPFWTIDSYISGAGIDTVGGVISRGGHKMDVLQAIATSTRGPIMVQHWRIYRIRLFFDQCLIVPSSWQIDREILALVRPSNKSNLV